ncbi:S41 family peptidase [Chloroflexota bacterium]
MKKAIIVIASIMAVCILLTGIFSAGLVVGGLILADRNSAEISQIIPPTDSANTSEGVGNSASSNKPGATPTEEETSFLSELNPFKSDESKEPPPESSEAQDELLVPLWEAWDIANEYYVDQPVDQELLMRGAIQGMLDAIGDPYTNYMDPESVEMFSVRYDGDEEYEGIGAWVDISKDYLTIISPFPESPADKAGLRPGDQIIAIDGEDMSGVDGELVRQQVLGPAGTTITVTILRPGFEPFDVDITRDSVVVPSTENYMMEDDIAYVRLILFGDTTSDELKEALKNLLAENPKGLILDLRYNGGGYLHSAVEVTSEFIEEGEVVVYEEYSDGSRETNKTLKGGLALEIPMVVLVNEGSASASEIVAGALQDYDRAPLVGSTTFGKGLVQTMIPLSNDQGQVRVTIARWLTPLERQIHEIGLEPDYPITVVYQAAIDEGFDIETLGVDPEDIIILSEEDVLEDKDPQLDKAVEVLKSFFE